MNGLALLCNLFADGPVTLKRLRSARVASLGELEREPPERLAVWLHASVPQARAFVEEARKLGRRLAEAGPLAGPPRPALRPGASAYPAACGSRAGIGDVRGDSCGQAPSTGAPGTHVERERPPAEGSQLVLRPGLVSGLDENACARLALHQVRTLQALGESAGLALARRTGIPYSTLLELARRARRVLAEEARSRDREPALRERELVPFARGGRERSRTAGDLAPGTERELARSDEFTLPAEVEPAAGPFG